MKFSIITHFLFPTFLFLLFQGHAFAQPKSYIVYLGSHHKGEYDLFSDPQSVTKSHHDMISSVIKSDSETTKRMIHSYNKVFNAFAATLHDEEANELKRHPDVISIFESQSMQPQTTRLWEFLGLLDQPHKHKIESHWEKARLGRTWLLQLSIQLIGARYFYKGFADRLKRVNLTLGEKLSPRDETQVQHGVHVASTILGNPLPGINELGLGNGTAKDGLYRARLASYKICWDSSDPEIIGCSEIDIFAAIESAIQDGVDIINLTLANNPTPYFQNTVAIGCFHAMKHDISCIASAGNSGPTIGTVSNVAPWIITVGATFMGRRFYNQVTVGNKKYFQGGSFSNNNTLAVKLHPLITGADAHKVGPNANGSLCPLESLDKNKVKGKILVCICTGLVDGVNKIYMAEGAGAIGIILANDQDQGYATRILSTPFNLLTSRVGYKDGQAIFIYINSTRSPVASITATVIKLGVKPAPVVGEMSSRGPNLQTHEILKPDIMAPGMKILAASRDTYLFRDGTSMASPHVAAVVGLLKKLHPHWSTSAIKSAIITTATTIDNTGKTMLEESLTKQATPFAYGAGQIQSNLAVDPGLVYDMDHRDYLKFLCMQEGFDKNTIKRYSPETFECHKSLGLLDFNCPSIGIFNFAARAITVTRKLKNVGQPGKYTARVEAPHGISIVVEPNTMIFSKQDQVIHYKLTFMSNDKKL